MGDVVRNVGKYRQANYNTITKFLRDLSKLTNEELENQKTLKAKAIELGVENLSNVNMAQQYFIDSDSVEFFTILQKDLHATQTRGTTSKQWKLKWEQLRKFSALWKEAASNSMHD